MAKTELSQERLRELLHYNPETGVFTHRIGRKGIRRLKGEVAGGLTDQGYLWIGMDYRRYRAHRLAWLYMTGEMPCDIDHINANRTDNRWCNLRLANRSQNMANSPRSAANTSGFKGVSWHKTRSKWVANIRKDYVQYYLGLFNSPEEAHVAYQKAAEELHGEFARGA